MLVEWGESIYTPDFHIFDSFSKSKRYSDISYIFDKMLLFILLSTASAFHNDDIQGVTVIKDNFPTSQANVEFGTGYNTVNLQRTYNSAVQVQRGLKSGGYIECTYRIKLCKSREEFLTSFSGGVSASASYMGVEGSASVKFLTETKITSLDSVLVASVDAITDTEIATEAQYIAAAQNLLDNQEFDKFVETYGTHYLRKVILGGKMVLVMKFSSRSQEDKQELDTKLGVSTGTFGAEAEFSAKMQEIRESSSLEVSLYASGSDTEPPKPDVQACIQYAIDFAKSVLTYSTVREVEYAGVWTIPGTPDSFKRYLFPLQAKTDDIVGISVSMMNVHSRLTDMLAQQDSDLAYFTPGAWAKVKELKHQVQSLRTELQNEFKTSQVSEFPALIEHFHGQPDLISDQVNEIVARERELGESVVLRSSGTGKYLSTHVNGYPRLDGRAPVSVKFQDISGRTDVTIGGNNFAYIRSVRDPSKALCMGKNDWFVFWSVPNGQTSCMWRLAHATDVNKKNLQYGDRLILYNRYWPSYVMGVSDDRRWVACVADTLAGSRVHQWVVERAH